MPGPSPTVRRRRLAAELRALREKSGLTIEQVAERMEVSSSKISRIETARVGTPPRDDSPAVWVILDEAVLKRVVGGPEVQRAQLQHLVEATALPRVTLQVLPFSAGAHAGLDGEFTIISK